ncbi:uncharacterized protein LOC135936114 [Cloeon dipterum]|uniref:uncharacterized protein LOC135936114 n=1 Tax=Cloeon dipterum TaxID=197152 RepID=UPI003220993F
MADGNLVTVASKKLRALQEMLLTDVVFLFGENDELRIPAFKFELMVCSEYFANLFNSPVTLKYDGKFRLENIEPHIFAMVVEFTHLSGQLVSNVDSLETCLKLACAAEEFMIDDLAALCSVLLEAKFLSVDNVWAVLSEHCLDQGIASPCLQLLRSETRECLRHRSFLDASEEAIKLFLTLEQMDISSESELLEACLQYASSKDSSRDVFRRCFLRDLRILVLDTAHLAKVAHFLTPEEKISIVNHTSPLLKMIGETLQLSPSLCPISEGRTEVIKIVGEKTLNLIRTSQILDPKEIYLEMGDASCLPFDFFVYDSDVHDAFTLILQPKISIKILGIEIVNELDFEGVAFGCGESFTRKAQQFEKMEVSVSNSFQFKGLRVHQEVKQDATSATKCGNCTFVKLSTLVPAGAIFAFKAKFKGSTFLRKLRFYDETLNRINEEATLKAFSRVTNGASSMFHDDETYTCENRKLAEETYCIFKSIRFADKDYE